MAKFRALFLEEATEHLSEIGSALLEFEKDTASTESIDVIFRMAHSIKSMAASVGYDSVTELSHALEDRMEVIRAADCVPPGDTLSVLFRGLEGLEQMVRLVSETGASPPERLDLIELLCQAPQETESPALLNDPVASAESSDQRASREPEPADAAELDVELVAVMAALEAESGAKKKLLH
jgi:two-component system chemotaxis sensor kinase CheA